MGMFLAWALVIEKTIIGDDAGRDTCVKLLHVFPCPPTHPPSDSDSQRHGPTSIPIPIPETRSQQSITLVAAEQRETSDETCLLCCPPQGSSVALCFSRTPNKDSTSHSQYRRHCIPLNPKLFGQTEQHIIFRKPHATR